MHVIRGRGPRPGAVEEHRVAALKIAGQIKQHVEVRPDLLRLVSRPNDGEMGIKNRRRVAQELPVLVIGHGPLLDRPIPIAQKARPHRQGRRVHLGGHTDHSGRVALGDDPRSAHVERTRQSRLQARPSAAQRLPFVALPAPQQLDLLGQRTGHGQTSLVVVHRQASPPAFIFCRARISRVRSRSL